MTPLRPLPSGGRSAAAADVAARMRQDWDARAREDAWAYIATNESTGIRFGLSAMRDLCVILSDVHEDLVPESRVLEIGCGVGRLLRHLALVFHDVHGIDVSPEMVRRAEGYLAGLDNVHVACGDGRGLAPYEDATFDFVFSYVVFQHVPEREVIREYLREARRVLKPDGLFKFLVKTGAWEGEGEAGMQADTWVGVTLTEAELRAWIDELGFELVAGYSHDAATSWVVVRRPV